MGKIPPQAKRVFQGVIFDVYHWEQKLYDGKTTATFEILKRADTASIFAVHASKILLIRDTQPHRDTVLTIPGGRVDPGESPDITALRELREETGYQATTAELMFTFDPSHKIEWVTYYYLASPISLEGEPRPGVGEQISLVWATWPEFLAAVREPEFQDKDLALHILRMDEAQLDAFRKKLGL